MLQYFLERGELKDREQFFELINDNISHEVGGDVMTLAEQLKEEGKLEVAKELFKNGADLESVAKATHFPLPKLKDLKKNN